MCLRVGHERCYLSGRAALRVWGERQQVERQNQGVGHGDRQTPGDAERALGLRALRRPLYFCDDLSSLQVLCVAVFPDGRRVVSGSCDNDKTLKVWDVATGKCVATLEGHSGSVRCGVHCTFVMIWLRRRSMALPCFRMGGASCLRRTTTRSRSGTWRPVNAWRRWKGTRAPCVAASTVLL